jgi:serine/threonine protein phosphatase PrpC
MHNNLKEFIKQKKNNYIVIEKEGYLLKKYTDHEVILRGGTTCTIIAIIDNMIYSSNVGDSTAILCSKIPIFNPDKQLRYLGDSATQESIKILSTVSSFKQESTEVLSTTMEITANHSPDNPSEFNRLHQFLKTPPTQYLVYDDIYIQNKLNCKPIFDNEGKLIPFNGKFYKNVRNEWGTLYTQPSTTDSTESLAFTRSVGDFYMNTFGVTHYPEIYSIDSNILFDSLDKNEKKTPLCLVVASDGVWDNWKYEDVANFVLDDNILESSNTKLDDNILDDNIFDNILESSNIKLDDNILELLNKKENIAKKLIIKNKELGIKHFSTNSDNATAIVIYLDRK